MTVLKVKLVSTKDREVKDVESELQELLARVGRHILVYGTGLQVGDGYILVAYSSEADEND